MIPGSGSGQLDQEITPTGGRAQRRIFQGMLEELQSADRMRLFVAEAAYLQDAPCGLAYRCLVRRRCLAGRSQEGPLLDMPNKLSEAARSWVA